MTCELCKKSQMNVGTYRLYGIIFEACTQCLRDFEWAVNNLYLAKEKELQEFITGRLEGTRNERNS